MVRLVSIEKVGSSFVGVRQKAGAFAAAIIFILVLNFQGLFSKNTGLSLFNNIDEALLILMLTLIIFLYLYVGSFKLLLEDHFKYFIAFTAVAILSLLLNSNKPLYGVIGFFEVTKGYLTYLIARHFNLSLKKVLLLEVIVFGLVFVHVCVGFFQELLGQSFLSFFTDKVDVRYGILRVSGLLTSINTFADYVVFFLAMVVGYRIVGVKVSQKVFLFLMTIGILGVVLTVSRQAIAGLVAAVVISAMHIYGKRVFIKLRKLFIFFSIMLFVMLAGILVNSGNSHYSVVPEGEYLRYYATFKSLEILSDHPLLGVGGGYFGGSTARIFKNNKIYDEYGFSFGGFSFEEMATIDTLWPQIWAEYGILGFILYLLIFLSILNYNKKLFHVAPIQVRNYCWALHVIVVYLIITSFVGPKLTNPVVVSFFLIQMGIVHASIKKFAFTLSLMNTPIQREGVAQIL